MFLKVILLSPPFMELTYLAPSLFPDDFWRPGLRVAVPLGKNSTPRCGYVREACEQSGLAAGTVCKEIIWPLETSPGIEPGLLSLAKALAERQGYPPGAPLGNLLPRGLRSACVKIRARKGSACNQISLSHVKDLPEREYAALLGRLLAGEPVFMASGEDLASQEYCILRATPPWPLRGAAKKQAEILDYLLEHGQVSRKGLLQGLGKGAGEALKKLIGKKLVEIGKARDEAPPEFIASAAERSFDLNLEQKNALKPLREALESGNGQCHLLYGVTGSGKTAVYLELAAHCLRLGRSALILAPEVALAWKLHRDARSALPDVPIIFHNGYQTPARREAIFRNLAGSRGPAIIIGARSALFLPLWKPGLIILDEEHDSSFKQDEGFPYHAKEVAWMRARHSGALLLLGSATPDIKTYHACKSGLMPLERLRKRVENRSLPPVRLVSLGEVGPMPGTLAASGARLSLLAPESEEALRKRLKAGEQAVILLNRRGYSAFIYCIGCQKILKCPQCDIGLSYHKAIGKLVCHYCGHSTPFPSPCPHCGSLNFLPMGDGTEKLAEAIEGIAGKKILRLDRDSARGPDELDRILGAFAAQKSPFLVGTQMLSKGHHFPNVTLALVADGDVGLNLPDYRAAERTFQLLVQAAGRAGRGEKPGEVIIQTRDPSHYCWRHLVNYDYEAFYEEELARRKRLMFPPFVKLALLRVSHSCDLAGGMQMVLDLGAHLSASAQACGARILGPAPAPLAMIRGRKRWQILLKAREWRTARHLAFLARKHPAARNLNLSLDLDPVNML